MRVNRMKSFENGMEERLERERERGRNDEFEHVYNPQRWIAYIRPQNQLTRSAIAPSIQNANPIFASYSNGGKWPLKAGQIQEVKDRIELPIGGNQVTTGPRISTLGSLGAKNVSQESSQVKTGSRLIRVIFVFLLCPSFSLSLAILPLSTSSSRSIRTCDRTTSYIRHRSIDFLRVARRRARRVEIRLTFEARKQPMKER